MAKLIRLELTVAEARAIRRAIGLGTYSEEDAVSLMGSKAAARPLYSAEGKILAAIDAARRGRVIESIRANMRDS